MRIPLRNVLLKTGSDVGIGTTDIVNVERTIIQFSQCVGTGSIAADCGQYSRCR